MDILEYIHEEDYVLDKLFNVAHALRLKSLPSCTTWNKASDSNKYGIPNTYDSIGLIIGELEELMKYRNKDTN